MSWRGKRTSRAGVTLIELLVVILIVIILAVALLPLLAPFVVKAKYAAGGWPALGNLRTKIELFQAENEYLPGLYRAKNGDVVYDPASGVTWDKCAYGSSQLADTVNDDLASSTVQVDGPWGQTVKMGALGTEYYRQIGTVSGGLAGYYRFSDIWSQIPAAADASISCHFLKDLEMDATELSDRTCNPEHFYYAAPCGKYKSGRYCYVLGCLGDGEKLATGTGIVILTLKNPAHTGSPKIVATWQRYKGEFDGVDTLAEQLNIAYVTPYTAIPDPTTALSNDEKAQLANNVYIPLVDLMSDTDADVNNAIQRMRLVGWKF